MDNIFIKSAIYQITDIEFCEPEDIEERFKDLIKKVSELKDSQYIEPLQSYIDEAENEANKHCAYIMLRNLYINNRMYKDLSQLIYCPPPLNIIHFVSIFYVPFSFQEHPPTTHEIKELKHLHAHEDAYIRIMAINILALNMDHEVISYFTEIISSPPTITELMYVVGGLFSEPGPNKIPPLLKFLQLLEEKKSIPLQERIESIANLPESIMEAGYEAATFQLSFLSSSHLKYLVLSRICYHRDSALLPIYIRNFGHKRYCMPCFWGLLINGSEKMVPIIIRALKKIVGSKMCLDIKEFPHPDPLVNAFMFLKSYVTQYPEIRRIYQLYTTENKELIHPMHLKFLNSQKKYFERTFYN